jgi:hypothetical protein
MLWFPCASLVAVMLAASRAGANPQQREATAPPGVLQRAIAVNQLSMQLTNCGSFASDGLFSNSGPSNGGLEFPRGSGKIVAFAGGLWFSGRAAGSLRSAITEYGTEFVPGPGVTGGPGLDTLRNRVYAISRGDTTGWGAWMARAVPLGAPGACAGRHPELDGGQTLWTVCTDAGVTAQVYGRGPRTPIGLEGVQLTAYAFDRAGASRHLSALPSGDRGATASIARVSRADADARSAAIPAASTARSDFE